MSFRRRIALLTAGAVAIAFLLASVGAYVAISDQLRGEVDDSLRDRARQFVQFRGTAATRVPPPPRTARLLARRPPRVRGGSDFFERFVAGDGTPLPRLQQGTVMLRIDSGAPAVAAGRRDTYLTNTRVDGEQVRMIVAPLPAGGAIQLGRSLEETADVLGSVRLILALVAIGGIALAALLGRIVAGRAIAPLARLTSAAEHVAQTGDLARRIDADSTDEIGRLATRFNAMLDTVEGAMVVRDASLQAQRRLIADASHELRTPVTSLRTNIEVLQANPALDALRRDELLTRATAQAEELTALVNDVVELGRGEEPDGGREPVRLDELVEEAIDRARRHAHEQDFAADLAEVTTTGSPGRLARAVNNLLDNAVRFNPAGAPIEVRLTGAGRLTVRDHGPGFAPEELDQVFDRFFRGAGARERTGSGLGLAIVRQVARAHRGSVGAANAAGGGALVTLSLPPRAPEPSVTVALATPSRSG